MMRKLATILMIVSIVVLIALIPIVGVSAAATACPGAPTPRLAVGSQARPAQVYSTLWASPNSTAVLTVMYKANGDVFTVQAGPQCAGGPYNWYQVNFKGLVGWVTEGTGSTYWVEPTGSVVPTPTTGAGTLVPTPTTGGPTLVPSPTPGPGTPTVTPPPATSVPSPAGCAGAPAPRLKVGGNARPAQVYSTLWQSPDSAVAITVMYRASGDVFRVTSGPTCNYAPYNWYQVNFKGTLGWVTEGTGSTYWVEPTS